MLRDRVKKEFSVVRHFVTRVFERFDLQLLLSVLLFKGDCAYLRDVQKAD